MSNTTFKISGYIASATNIIGALFIIPKKSAEYASENVPVLSALSAGVSAIGLGSTYVFSYNKYFDKVIKKQSALLKWCVFAVLTITIIKYMALIYVIAKETNKVDPIKTGLTRVILPFVQAGLGGLHIILLIAGSDKFSVFRLLYIINKLLAFSEFLPIEEGLKKVPKIYFPLLGVRTILKMGEGAALFIETTLDNDSE